MRILESFLVGIYSMRVANRLFDLGVDSNRLGITCGAYLYEIERERRNDLSPHEAAAYFFAATFSDLPRNCYIHPISSEKLAFVARAIFSTWVRKGKMRAEWAASVEKTLISQL